MHTVGRTYATERHLTLGTLMDYLPQSNDPGCTAGFAHGMVTAVAPDIDPTRPGEAARICGSARTRYQEYSCIHGFGHAFMRIYGDRLEPALHLCAALGQRAAADCAQGAYHDYWFAVIGADDTSLQDEPVRDPRRLCGDAPARFVRPCWYRVWLENRTRRAAGRDARGDRCALLRAERPAAVGVRHRRGADRAGRSGRAARAVRADAGRRRPGELRARRRRCRTCSGSRRRRSWHRRRLLPARRGGAGPCYRWLGKAVSVLTDGAFARDGCPRLRGAAARRECAAGARTMDQALETFS